MREWLIFPSLAAVCLALMTFHSAWWGLGLLYLSIRVYCLRDGQIFYSYLMILALVAISAYYQRPRLAPAVTDNQASFTVRMPINQLSVDGDQVAFKGQVIDSDYLQKHVQCYYRLGSESEKADWLALDESVVLEVEGHIELPKENRNRQLFNYRRYLKQKNIYYILVIDTVAIAGPDQSLSGRWAQGVYRFINKFSDMTPSLVRDYSLSLFFNQSDAISQPVYQAYQKLGLIHLFAISGFHVNFLLKQMKNIFLRLGLSVEAFDYLALAFLLLYTAALAFPHGLLRASGAYLYNSWQIRHDREPSTFVGTAGVMLATLFLKPSAVLSLSFQLSYLLAFTIILMGRALTKWQEAFWLRGLLLNFLCSLLIMPILMINFHEFSWLNLLLNGLYSFVFANFLFPGLLLAMGLHLLNWQLVSRPLLWTLNGLIQGVENFSLWAQSWPFFHWITGQPPLYLLAILLTSILCFCLALEGRRYIKIASLFLILSLLLVYVSPYLNPWGTVQMVDIGQGDCLLVSLPHQRGVYLIDVGERMVFDQEDWQEKDTASTVSRHVLPSLKALGVRHIDGIFITHGDYDHMGGLEELATEYPIDRIYLPIGMAQATDKVANIKQIAQNNAAHSQISWVKTGDHWELDQTTYLQVLAPNDLGTGSNEDSLVMWGKFGPKSILLTGDADGKGEAQTMAELDRLSLEVDILKVAHHGSDHSTSAAYITTVDPNYAWISVGANNRYGHPADRVLVDLQEAGTRIMRTDQMGGVYYHFTQNSAKIELTAQEWERR